MRARHLVQLATLGVMAVLAGPSALAGAAGAGATAPPKVSAPGQRALPKPKQTLDLEFFQRPKWQNLTIPPVVMMTTTADEQRKLQLMGWALPTRNSKQRAQDYQIVTLTFSPDTRPAMREQLDDCFDVAVAYTQRMSDCLERIENVTGADGQVVHTVDCDAKMKIILETDSLPSQGPYELPVDKLGSLTCRSG